MSKVATLIGFVVLAGTVYGHHSTVAIFDATKTVEITGVVADVSWRNPHGRIVVEVDQESGETLEWTIETPAVSIMRNRGLSTELVALGDRISVAGEPARRDPTAMNGRNILLASGYELAFNLRNPYFPAGKSGNLVGREFDESNAAAAIASADGIFRVWSTVMNDPAAFPMFKGGYPLTAAAEAIVDQWDPLNNSLLRCGTKGTPLLMITPFPIEFVRQNEDIVMRIEEFDGRRLIHMNPDAVAPGEHTLFGFSRGRWEGTTLVVRTDHIAAGYFDPDGVPQSENISVVERFIPDETYDRLDYRMTVTDPEYFTESFDLTRYFVWRPENIVHPYECLERY